MEHLKSVCVYCGSSDRVDERYKAAARNLGRLLANGSFSVVYGGGRVGLMGILADSALENKGSVVGIIPSHIREKEVDHPGLTELHVVDNMHSRKMMMFDRSDAFVILPGGLGTLDETFEIITWRQLGVHDKPIVLVNLNGYWDALLRMVDQMIDEGFANDSHRKLFRVVDTVDEVLPALETEPEPTIAPDAKWM